MGNPNGRPRAHGWRTGNHGYRILFDREHPCTDRSGVVLEHVAVATAVLGKSLPAKAQIHHINGDKQDNRPANLVICQDRAYHMLLHQRQNALRSCGHATWRKCGFCHQYDDPINLANHGHRSVVHRDCARRYKRARYARHAHNKNPTTT
jgi:hypothetical protein